MKVPTTKRKVSCSRHDEKWLQNYNILKVLGETLGDCNIQSRCVVELPNGEEENLGDWLRQQRKYHRKGKLQPDREARLQALVNEGKLSWSGSYTSKSEKYKSQKDKVWDDNFALFDADKLDRQTELQFDSWQGLQRKLRRAKKLNPECESKLNEMVTKGKFVWSLGLDRTDDKNWDYRYSLLVAYGEEHNGDCNVPTGYVSKIAHEKSDSSETFIEEIRLGMWLSRQRTGRAKGELREDRRERLQKLVDEGKLLWFTGRGPNNDWQESDEKATRKRKRTANAGNSSSDSEQDDEEEESSSEDNVEEGEEETLC